MTTKEAAKRVIDRLPDDVSIEEIIRALDLNAKFERGEREIREGKGVPHEEAVERIRKWAR